MKFAYDIPDSFWSLFRSMNRELYMEALLKINEEYEYNNYYLSKEVCLQVLEDWNESQRIWLSPEEFESETDASQTPPNRILNWLIKTGWLKRIEDFSTLTTNIIIPDYAAVFLTAFEELVNPSTDDTEIYIQNVYATLFSFWHDKKMNLAMLKTALVNTKKGWILIMNNLTFKQKIIFGIIITTMVIFILIYFIMNSGNLTGKEGIDELSEEEGMLNIEDINETIEGSEENEIIKNGENNKDITLNGEVVNAESSSINNGKLIKYDYATSALLGEDGAFNETYTLADTGTEPMYRGSLTTLDHYYWNNDTGTNTWSESDLNKINLAYILEDGQKIYIPNKSEKIENNEYIIDGSGNNAKSNSLKEVGKVNINEAMQTELEQLPGIGPSLATRIIEYREQNGNFNNVEDLQNVKGIGDAKFNDIKDKVTV